LLTCGEHELLAAIGAGQVLVVVHETKTPLGSRRDPSGFLAAAVRGVRVGVELRLFSPLDASDGTSARESRRLTTDLYRGIFADSEESRFRGRSIRSIDAPIGGR